MKKKNLVGWISKYWKSHISSQNMCWVTHESIYHKKKDFIKYEPSYAGTPVKVRITIEEIK